MHRATAQVMYAAMGGKEDLSRTWKIFGDGVGKVTKIVVDKDVIQKALLAQGLNPDKYKWQD